MVDIQKIAKLFVGDYKDAIDYLNTCVANTKDKTDYPDDYKIVHDYIKIVQSENTTERYMYTQKFVLDHGQKMLIDLCCAIDDINRKPEPVVSGNVLTDDEVELLQKERDKFSLSLDDESKEFSRNFCIGPGKQIQFNI